VEGVGDARHAAAHALKKEEYETHARGVQEQRRRIRAERRPESEMDALFTAQRDWEETFFGAQPAANQTGAFEGAMYEARGYYRPQLDCVMFTRDRVPFCSVCQHALSEVIDLYASPAKAPASPR